MTGLVAPPLKPALSRTDERQPSTTQAVNFYQLAHEAARAHRWTTPLPHVGPDARRRYDPPALRRRAGDARRRALAAHVSDPASSLRGVPEPHRRRAPRCLEPLAAAARIASRIAVAPHSPPRTALTASEIETLAALYDAWTPGTAYALGDVVAYDDGNGPRLWEVRQAHT